MAAAVAGGGLGPVVTRGGGGVFRSLRGSAAVSTEPKGRGEAPWASALFQARATPTRAGFARPTGRASRGSPPGDRGGVLGGFRWRAPGEDGTLGPLSSREPTSVSRMGS